MGEKVGGDLSAFFVLKQIFSRYLPPPPKKKSKEGVGNVRGVGTESR